jgi:type II restriction/modification system DNA methylase subunit YeeA
MTPYEFLNKWRNVELKERTASQSHFNDLCALIGVEDPITADPKGEWFTFEKGATKTGGGEGWADVWRKGCFAWEYKGRAANLDKAFDQLLRYSIALESPPLLIVSDMERIRIHTHWTNTAQRVREINLLDDLYDAKKRDLLRDCFLSPEKLRPSQSRQMLTEAAAREFATLAQRLRERGHEAHTVAHFIHRLVFCMFAEHVHLLPATMLQRMLDAARAAPEQFAGYARTLFGAMKSGGMVGFENVDWFNGGLFDDDSALPLERADIDLLRTAAKLDWSDIDPSILGTLFERGLDPGKRSQLGAHYTDRDKIMQIVRPVIVEPLQREWAQAKEKIEAELTRTHVAKGSAHAQALKAATAIPLEFLERLKHFRVLDPACGSGNFLNLSLLALKDIEHRANVEAEALGLPRQFPGVGPENVLGIELNPYAAELARVSVWIGEIQWMRRNGFEAGRNPILRALNTIENRDALLNEDGTEAVWPQTDVIVGNPPFLGGSKKRGELGDDYFNRLNAVFDQNVPGGVDLVCYWFHKARKQIEANQCHAAGLVATNSIRGGANRTVLGAIVGVKDFSPLRIFEAWSDEPWVNEGAAVRVSLICFGRFNGAKLDGQSVETIHADLTAVGGLDFSRALPLAENTRCSFQGSQKIGAFDISGDLARSWLNFPNPNGKPNSDVLKPSWNGMDITRRPRDGWIIDFGTTMSEEEVALYEKPVDYVIEHVKPERLKNQEEACRIFWWRHGRPRIAMRSALTGFTRYIVTPCLSKHRIFVWLNGSILPDKQLTVIARDDDITFGILHSRFHELWSLRMGTSLEDRPRYTPTTCFETFSFPEQLTPQDMKNGVLDTPQAKAIAEAAKHLDALRNNWLNPPEWTDWVITPEEVKAHFPKRLVAKPGFEGELKKRTLTNLYNQRPAWLDMAHKALDKAAAAAYGWVDYTPDMPDDEILARLFRLNQEKASR